MKPNRITRDASLVRQVNTRATLKWLRKSGIQTLTQISHETGLSRPTVEAVLDDLRHRGLIEELGPAEGGTGRPARRFRFLAEAGHVLGIDIGPRRILTMVADLNGEIVAQARVEVDEHLPAADRLALAERAASACVASKGILRSRVWAAAAGTSGVVDRSGRITVSSLIPGWTGLDLAGQVGRWFQVPGFAANDANLAVVAEHWRGSARHVEDVVYVLSGYRSGHGLLLGGRLHTGRTGAAGELGKLPLMGWEDPSVVLSREGRPAEAVFEAARHGEPRALGVVDQLAYGLAKGAAAIVLVVDPELVVVGGGFALAGELLLGPMRRHLATMCVNAPDVVASTFGEESVALGAVRLALDHVESRRLDL